MSETSLRTIEIVSDRDIDAVRQNSLLQTVCLISTLASNVLGGETKMKFHPAKGTGNMIETPPSFTIENADPRKIDEFKSRISGLKLCIKETLSNQA